MMPNSYSLPEFSMTAGESKNLYIPIYHTPTQQVDASGVSARLAVCDFVNPNMAPYFHTDCTVVPGLNNEMAVLYVVLKPEQTIDLSGKYLYQITGKDSYGDLGIMRGVLYIWANRDKDAVSAV